jgi:hypothetical protein
MSAISRAISNMYNVCPYNLSCERMYGTLSCDGKKESMTNCGRLESFTKGKKDCEIWEV